MSRKSNSPVLVRCGGRSATLYCLANGKRQIKYYDNDGKLVTGGTFNDLAKARRVAYEQLEKLDRANMDREGVTDIELAMIRAIREGDVTLAEVTRLADTKRKTARFTVSDALGRWYADDIEKQNYSKDHLAKVSRARGLLAGAFGDRRLSGLTFFEVDAWVAGWSFGYKQHNNLLSLLKRFSRWCKPRGLLLDDPFAAVANMPASVATHDILTPAELQVMLLNCPEQDIPWLALSAFGGLRLVEICGRRDNRETGLRWEDVFFDSEQVIINSETAKKTARSGGVRIGAPRIIPMCPALISWLEPWRDASGLVHRHRFPAYKKYSHLESLTDKLGGLIGGWRNNALRASRASYRLALLNGDVGRVKLEMGHNERMLVSQYNNPRFKAEAVEYFSLSRERVLGV